MWQKEVKTQILLAQSLRSTVLSEMSVSERQSVPVKDPEWKKTQRSSVTKYTMWNEGRNLTRVLQGNSGNGKKFRKQIVNIRNLCWKWDLKI